MALRWLRAARLLRAPDVRCNKAGTLYCRNSFPRPLKPKGDASLNRRQMIAASAVLPLATALPRRAFAAAPPAAAPVAFSPSYVRELARGLAGKPFEPPDEKLPDALKDLGYEEYRSIRFLPERALWRNEKLPFEAQFFHRGFFYKSRIDIFEVAD